MQNFVFILELIGTVSFAVSGAIASIDKEMDIFGVLFLSLTTCFGGGLMRDVLIDRTPAFFTSFLHIGCAVVTALAVFILAAAFKRQYIENERVVDSVNNYFDAAGLGVFAVMGTKICIGAGFDSPLVAIFLGMLTSVGGGMIRDLCLRKIPFVFNKRVYAVASLLGASLYYLLLKISFIPEYLSFLAGIILVVAIRILATVFKLNMPKAIIFKKDSPRTKNNNTV